MNLEIIISSTLTAITVVISAYWLHKRETNKHKLEVERYRNELALNEKEKKQDKLKLDFFNRAMDLSRINPIIEGVDKMFNRTVADRFLILIAVNGKEDFNIVSVIFEQHKPSVHKVNAIGTYRNINIDDAYRKMLKLSEMMGIVEIDVAEMEDCILKDFYNMESITHSKIRFLGRQKIDDENDFLIYSSLATHSGKPFTNKGKTLAKLVYESTIIPNIQKILN